MLSQVAWYGCADVNAYANSPISRQVNLEYMELI
jgi:hypothetical protein